jgi:hypothetical protein
MGASSRLDDAGAVEKNAEEGSKGVGHDIGDVRGAGRNIELQQLDDQAKKRSQEDGEEGGATARRVCRQIRAEEKAEGHEADDV